MDRNNIRTIIRQLFFDTEVKISTTPKKIITLKKKWTHLI
jgi:hypothetical protein